MTITISQNWNRLSTLSFGGNSGLFHQRQFEPESSSFSQLAVDAEIGVVKRQYLLYDGQAKTASFRGTHVVGAGFVISVPYVRKFFLGNTGTVVRNLESVFLAHPLDAYRDLFIFAAVFDSVVYQIGHYLLYLVLVTVSVCGRRRIEGEFVTFLLGKDIV